MKPSLRQEKKLWKKGHKRVVGLDEAGRGPIAGPVTAAAVTISPAKIKNHLIAKQLPTVHTQQGAKRLVRKSKIKNILREIKDSKKLAIKKREAIYKILINHLAIKWGTGRVSEKVIDKINILEATKLAMKRAVQKLKQRPNFLIVDGNFGINSSIPQRTIIKGDEKVFSCAAASIIAKVSRDRIMKRYHKKYPRYGFNQHKGYPTKYHRKMLKKYGPCKIHRKSFRPVKGLCERIK